MVNVLVMFGGFVLVMLGVLVGTYLSFEKRRGNLVLKPLSIKSNVAGNLTLGLVIVGVLIIAISGLTP